MCVFLLEGGGSLVLSLSHLLWIHRPLGTLGGIRMEPQDGFVTHGAHTADLQPLEQAPEGTKTGEW